MLYNASTATESGWEYGGPKRSGKEIEIISHTFSDGTKLRTVLDSQDGDRTKLAVTRGGRVKLVNLFKYGSDVFVPHGGTIPAFSLWCCQVESNRTNRSASSQSKLAS